MKKTLLISSLLAVLLVVSCKGRENESLSLPIVLKKINQIGSATYASTNFFCYSGDTIPLKEKRYEYFIEHLAPLDTSVGAYYVKFDLADTTKMTFAYDGNIRARINWDEYHFQTDDFSKNPRSYRTVIAPFFAKSKALIEYALSTEDSLVIDSVVTNEHVRYQISIFNERVELVGRLPIHIDGAGSNNGVVSEYVLWVNRITKLPYKFQRTLPANTMVEEISQLRVNESKMDNFSAANYIPSDMLPRSKNELSDALLNKESYNFRLSDLDGQFHALEDIDSKVFIINLTSLFCGACVFSIPYLNELNQKYDPKDFSFVSLYDEKERPGLLKEVEKKDLSYNILLADKQAMDAYSLGLVPAFLILDEEKIVRKVIYGFSKGKTEMEIENSIRELLQGKQG